MNWDKAIKTITPHVVKITTPSGHGTGFLAFYNHDSSWCGIATAAHVVAYADEWQQPIKIIGETSQIFLKEADRMIFVDRQTDSAVVLFIKRDLQLPQVPIPLMPLDCSCDIGIDVGWLGYPAIAADNLCFFSGAVSARPTAAKAYLIDGVAINGVSGGPVFHCPDPDSVQIIGAVSAYYPNRATGETLPGLARAQDVSHFHGIAGDIRDWDEAAQAKREFDEAQKQQRPEGESSPPEQQRPEAAE